MPRLVSAEEQACAVIPFDEDTDRAEPGGEPGDLFERGRQVCQPDAGQPVGGCDDLGWGQYGV